MKPCVVVIECGSYTGILPTCAVLLEQGLESAVLEAAKVGFGASGRNGGRFGHSYSRDIDCSSEAQRRRNSRARLLGRNGLEGRHVHPRTDGQISDSVVT